MSDLWTARRKTRPDKIEEIKVIWDSPNFKTNSQRLVHLMRHCKKIEYGYTIREFAHAIFPEKMTGPLSEEHWKYFAFAALHQMFRRFRKDVQNHEIGMFAGLVKGTGTWYYYNMIEDEEGWKDVKLRQERIALGYDRALAQIKGISEMSDEDRELFTERMHEEIMRKVEKRLERKKVKKSNP
jgi:hypothetical protein